MQFHTSSPKRSNVLDGQEPPSSSPPPYEQSPNSPLLLSETTTTRTETVTTTTTETTTHFFSLPYWKKRNGTQSPALQRNSVDNLSGYISSNSAIHPPFVNKALPPTPPEFLETSPDVANESPGSTSLPSPIYIPEYIAPQQRKATNGTQSATALAHAALGIGLPHVGLPHASASFPHPEKNTIPFTSTSSFPFTPSVRRAKSTHRIQTRHVSETQENDRADENIERRNRGLSFSAGSFLNIGNSDPKGKGKESSVQALGPVDSSAIPSKPLVRKSSFWNRRKGTEPTESLSPTPNAEGENSIVLPSLPPVHHISPFDISDFPNVPPITSMSDSPNSSGPSRLSRSHSDKAQLVSPNLLPDTPTVSSSVPWPTSHPKAPSNDGITEILQSNGNPTSIARPRRQTSTPLLHRLSLGVFLSPESSPSPNITNDQPHVFINSPILQTPRKPETPFPKPLTGGEESPEVYLSRLKTAVSKSEVAGILASSSDSFYARALREYINQFDFLDIPLDIALRKLLMEVGLPRETQQIDRVIEAFALRYVQCNADIYTSDDHPYILAFSLIMLHTDAFNPSNKRKMTKADYIKNTKLPGIPTEVLDCFFDNIVFAPFIFIEDPVDFNGQPGLLPDLTRPLPLATPTSATSINTVGSFKMGNRVDPYYLIINHLLQPLRVDVNSVVPLENPFTYEGTNGPWEEQGLHQAFINAHVIEIDVPVMNRSMSLFARSPIGKQTSASSSFNGDSISSVTHPTQETWNLKITKVGLLSRKDDVTGGGKKSSNRKWKTWAVVLTGSQLLFFRDQAWVAALSPSSGSSDQIISPPSSVFRPDESFSVKDAIVVFDNIYTKYKHAMRFVLPDGRQLLLQASDDKDLNEWISRINYASTFKTAGVRIRPPGLSSEDALLTGVAAATSHLHDLQQKPDISRARSWDSNAPHDLMDMLSGPPPDRNALKRRVTMANVTMANGTTDSSDIDVPVAPEVEGADQFKATFDQVKADLASTWSSEQELWLPTEDEAICDSPLSSPSSVDSSSSRLPSRSQIIQSKIRELDSKIAALQPQIDSDMRFLRNIAILTPFQKSTRSRLTASVQGSAKRITQTRLEMEKLKCHRDVLRSDLSSEGRSWNHSKQVALRVAKKTLQSRRAQTVPKMSLALPYPSTESSPTGALSRLSSATSSQRPNSSPCDSFHSAVESTFRWPSSESVPFLTINTDSDSALPNVSRSSFSIQDQWKNEDQRPVSSSLSSDSSNSDPVSPGHDNDLANMTSSTQEDELAEEWNRTRCAHRVSLIHVPSNIKISTRLPSSTDS